MWYKNNFKINQFEISSEVIETQISLLTLYNICSKIVI